MDNLIQKFYSNGKEEEQKYTQFGAFSNSLMKNSGLKFIKPNIGLVNPAIHNMENTSTKLLYLKLQIKLLYLMIHTYIQKN